MAFTYLKPEADIVVHPRAWRNWVAKTQPSLYIRPLKSRWLCPLPMSHIRWYLRLVHLKYTRRQRNAVYGWNNR